MNCLDVRQRQCIFIKQTRAYWIVDDSRSRADRDRRSLRNLTDDRKFAHPTTGDPPARRGAGRVHRANQIKPKNHCEFVFPRTVSGDYRSLPTIISRERRSAAPSGARKRTRTGEGNCDIQLCDPRDARDGKQDEEQFRAQRIASSIS